LSRLRPSFPFFFLAPSGAAGISTIASSTDNAIARWDGTGGATLQNSGVTIDDSNNIVAPLTSALTIGTIELGNATDTTLARSAAGTVTIEGNEIYRAGGTDVVVADGGTGRGTATAYAVICGGTVATGAHQSIAGLGSSGQVLTSNGAGALPTFQAAAGGIEVPHQFVSTAFETDGRFASTDFGSGTSTFGNSGYLANTSATGSSGANVGLQIRRSEDTLEGGAIFSIGVQIDTLGTDFDFFVGFAEADSGTTAPINSSGGNISFFVATTNHVGFRIFRDASGSTTLVATNSGGTQTATTLSTALAVADYIALCFEYSESGGTIDYYFKINNGAWSSATQHSTNIPTTDMPQLAVQIGNRATATQTQIYAQTMSYMTF